MRDKVRWGVLGVARIATTKVIPAMQCGRWTEVTAIASRDVERARRAAASLGIPKAYGSYEELLNDLDIDAIYNPLPNQLHVPWSIRAAEAGKHVLCEKPIGLSTEETRALLAARDRTGVKIQEAFMVRAHPQWIGARDIVRSGRIGRAQSILGCFSYFNRDAANIRNVPAFGGGALMDIGCYLVNTSRFIFDEEPRRVIAAMERDPDFGVDRLTSMLLEYPSGHAAGTCGTQMVAHQRVNIFGARGRIEIEIPFNAPPDRPCRLFVDDGSDLFGAGVERVEFETCNQYQLQGDLLSQAIRDGAPAPYPLEDSIKNMAVIEALFRSAASGRWEAPES
jgi:predicted dehydrogenase